MTLQLKLSHVNHITLLSLIPLLFSICRSSTNIKLNAAMTQVGCIEIERQALLQIKAAFTDDPHGKLSSWTGQDCCSSWTGVRCSNITGHVEELDLNRTSLAGDLSSSITDLKYLTYLDLSYNDFQNKAIPEFIGSIERLNYLDMSCSLFGGVIPPQLGNLSNLVELHLNYIDCTAAYHISELSWLSSLSSLQHLVIRNVDLSLASEQWLQSVSMLSNLKSLDISACGLTNLPQSLPFVNLTSLTHLYLSGNQFNSLIPTWLSNASSLEIFDIGFSRLKGRIPGLSFANMRSLQAIELSDNLLDGGLAELIDTLADCSNRSIRALKLKGNQLQEYLPDSLGRLRNLNIIDLSHNKLFGSIPRSIGNLAKLRMIDLSDNLMNGTIPESLGQLDRLQDLQISGNQWQGVIRDAHLSNLVNLFSIELSSSSKSLIFNISVDWSPPFNLFLLNIWDCQLGPFFPAWVASQTNLQYLCLRNTSLSSTIHAWMWKMSTQLYCLDLSENQLQGNLPAMLTLKDRTLKDPHGIMDLGNNLFEGTLPRLSNINHLSLRNNQLTGVIPSDLFGQQLPYLIGFDLSGNKLSGYIPEKWNTMKHLVYIDFSSNNLSGEVPEEMCLLPSLKWLQLSNNNLSGEPCNSVTSFTSLMSIDLGENSFSGNVPKWRGDSLKEIRLHDNLFSGSIPAELCSLPFLHVLDISQNKLSGPIPPCFGKMSGFSELRKLSPTEHRFQNVCFGFERQTFQIGPYTFKMKLEMKGYPLNFDRNLPLLNVIDLSGNELSGKIPEEITNLSYLRGLNLSRNQINGHIPENIGFLINLESLDLSKNALDGHIPSSLASITTLSQLNLSHNNLSGPIPTKNQFQTFNDLSIYEDNPGLCGTPLFKLCNANKSDKDHSDNSLVSEKMMLVTSIVLGFIFGCWAVCGTLLIKKSWRDAYFRFLGI